MNATRSNEISGVVRALPQDAQDTLMKYLYKGMSTAGMGDTSGNVLLGWHEKVRTSHCTSEFELTVYLVNGGCWDGMHRAHDD